MIGWSFIRVDDWSYNSVMTTGNLRRFAEGLFAGTIPRQRDPASLRAARTLALGWHADLRDRRA